MRKGLFALLLAVIMIISIFGTMTATAQSSNQPILQTTSVKQASFTGSYTGEDKIVAGTESTVISTTRGKFSGSATLTFNGKHIDGEGSGIGKGQVFFSNPKISKNGPYPTEIQLTLNARSKGSEVQGTFSVDVTIPEVGTQHLEGPFQGTFDGTTMVVPWSGQIDTPLEDGSVFVSEYQGVIEFVVTS